LWTDGPVEERDGQLIRADLKEYTYPRALELFKHLRGASPREWGEGRSYRMGMLTWHGGPLSVLSGGALKVKVAPVMQGRIWSVTYGGKEVISQSVDELSSGARYYELVGRNNAIRAEMQAELGIGHWSPNTKQIARKTVEVSRDGSVEIKGMVKRLNDEVKTVSAKIETQYKVGADLNAVQISTRSKDGSWQPVTISGDKVEIDRADSSQLKIIRPAESVVVLDEYLDPRVKNCKIAYDKATGLIKTIVELDAVTAPTEKEGEGLYMHRRFTVQSQK
jgi:hypothetical protein